MKIALVSDAWAPQVNGVVTTLIELHRLLVERGHAVTLIEPSTFRRFPCPGYREIELAWRPEGQVVRRLDACQPDAIHIATEGPIGAAARRHCLRRGLRFTTTFHTRFPDILARAIGIPEAWGYAWFRRFHAPSARVLVPTAGMLAILQQYRFRNLHLWTHGVDRRLFKPVPGADLGLPRPVFLNIGRLSYEKNLEAFLQLDLPGTKVVYGSGPLAERLRGRYPDVHWGGIVDRAELPRLYSAADVMVFPSRSDTFGLVMLEAMACGTPVAAFPVAGPLDVIGPSGAGAMDEDLRAAAMRALAIDRGEPVRRAADFDWDRVCEDFVAGLVPASRTVGVPNQARARLAS
jgi:glycosyltransferase involved in cell wall biosynthesis